MAGDPGPHFLSDALLDRAKARLAQPAFRAAAARLRDALREDLARPALVPAPDRPAGYYHDYFCPEHGVQLEFDWDSPHAHRCPADGAVYRGEPYDRSWWWFVNHAHSEAGFRLALGWRLLEDPACLEKLETLLAAYAAHYPGAGWPMDDPRGRQGKVAYHALDEAVWLIPLAWAYDVARGALPAEARRGVEERLLEPAAEHLLRQRWMQVHNYMCWLNAGVATAARLVGRSDLLADVTDGPYGVAQQVREGVLADGTWWEGSASYHFYTLAALLATVRATGNASLRRDVRRMFAAPLRWAYPDLALPAINDCWYHSSLVGEVGHGIPPAAAFYEVAAGWYGDAAFEAILAANYGGGRARDTLEALLFGPDSVSGQGAGAAGRVGRSQRRTPRLLAASANLPDLGVAVLRGPAARRAAGAAGDAGEDRRTFVLLKYGRHGGGHGHPDKLGIVLAGGGERLSPDLGTPGYGIALNDGWYRHTLSHNTVLIDGQRQPPATGRLLRFASPRWSRAGTGEDGGASRAFGLIDAEVEWPRDAHDVVLGAHRGAQRAATGGLGPAGAYEGVRLRRLVLLHARYVVDVFWVSCPTEREIEWAYHNLGRLTRVASARAAHGGGPDVDSVRPAVPDVLRVTHTLPGDRDLVASFATGGVGLRAWLSAIQTGPAAGESPPRGAWVVAAEAPANPASETMALVLRRCRAGSAVFASVLDPHTGPVNVRDVAWSRVCNTLRCDVERQRAIDRWEIPLREGSAARLTTRREGVQRSTGRG